MTLSHYKPAVGQHQLLLNLRDKTGLSFGYMFQLNACVRTKTLNFYDL